jgi:NAD(P)H-dependent FMN reductase
MTDSAVIEDVPQHHEGTPILLTILGSVRPGRVGQPVAEWFSGRVQVDGRFSLESVDLGELALPALDEPNHPRMRKYTQSHTQAWSKIVEKADAIVIITPEYNHGYPGSLKDALDYLNQEWKHKPIGFISYGGVSAGTRAVAQLQQVTSALNMVPAATAITLPFVAQLVQDGALVGNEVMEQAAAAMLDELLVLEQALGALRARG